LTHERRKDRQVVGTLTPAETVDLPDPEVIAHDAEHIRNARLFSPT